MAKIVISEFMDNAAVQSLRDHHDVHHDETLADDAGTLKSVIAQADALIVRNRTQVTAGLIADASNLKAVGRLGVGLDNIDLDACRARSIAVLPATGANAISVAEYVLCTAMMLLRGPVFFGTAELLAASWPRPEMSRGEEINGKTMGLVGFGSIGQTTAKLARATGFRTIAHDAFLPADDAAWATTERYATLAGLLEDADVISVHCPLTPQTEGLVGQMQFAAMKPGAIIINTARGGIIDESALAEALRSGRLGGAATDVFASEPITQDTAALFTGVPNLILTPHVAGVTKESNERISAITAENVLRALQENSP